MHKITPFELLERIVDIVRCNLNNFPANIGFIESEEDEAKTAIWELSLNKIK